MNYNDIKLIALVLGVFILTFLTSALLEIPFFTHPLRYVLVCLLIVLELYFGFLVLKNFLQKKLK